MLSKTAKRQYVQEGGARCPFRLSQDITADAPLAEGGIVIVPVDCEDCRKRWHERDDLAAIYELGEDDLPIFEDKPGKG